MSQLTDDALPPPAAPPIADKSRPPKKRRGGGKIAALVLTGGAAALVLGGLGTFLWVTRPAAVADSPQSEQAKQRQQEEKAARDAWQAAALMVRPDQGTLMMLSDPSRNRANARRMAQMTQMRQRFALAAAASATPGSRPFVFRLPPPPPTAAEVLARNAPALRAIRAALPLPYRVAPDDASSSNGGGYSSFRSTQGFPSLGCLLLLDGNEKQKKGDTAGAASAYLDIIQLGQTLARGGPTAALSASGGFQSVGQAELWKLVDKMDAPTARQTAKRLETLCAETDAHVSYAAALVEEKTRGDAALHDLFRDPKRLQQVRAMTASMNQSQARMQAQMAQMQTQMQMRQRNRIISGSSRTSSGGGGGGSLRNFPSQPVMPPPPPPPVISSAPWDPLVQRWNEWKMVRELDANVSEQIAVSRLPYQAQIQAMRQKQPHYQGQSSSSYSSGSGYVSVSTSSSGGLFPTTSIMYTPYGSPGTMQNALNQWTTGQAENRLLLAALARQAFRAEHADHDPAALADLVPAYLSHVPDDPYALPVAPLRFQNGVLYSVGPDGKDDHGTPIRTASHFGGGLMFAFYGMPLGHMYGKGDMVAGKTGP